MGYADRGVSAHLLAFGISFRAEKALFAGLFDDVSVSNSFRERVLWNIRLGLIGSVRLDAGELHHLCPLLGFVGDELAEIEG